MSTNLPNEIINDSAAKTKLFFDSYGDYPLEFSANDIDATIGFFENAGFDKDAAVVISASILKQAKKDSMPVFKILDSLKKFNNIEISALVAEILNNDRSSISTLGFKVSTVVKENLVRNIRA